MFSVEEAQALVASVRMAQVWQDPALAQASQVALGKILSVLPPAARAAAQAMAVYAPPIGLEPAVQTALAGLRAAAHQRARVRLSYADADAQVSERSVRPLGCFFWGRVWTLAAWCESRADFRSFRLDRIRQWRVEEGAGARFTDEPGKTLGDFLRRAAPPGTQERLTEGS
jgi:predicted DNA-binding transcriptional regulator YafY